MKIRANIKEHLWTIGLLVVIAGVFLIGLFILSNEEIYFFRDLSQYTPGFFITGLVTLDFGVLFALIPLYAFEEKKNNKTKTRTVLIVLAVIFLILLGYLLAIKDTWIVEAWIFEYYYEFYKVFNTFTFTNYNAFFVTLISLGISVLPFVVAESGILDNYPDEPPDPDVEKN